MKNIQKVTFEKEKISVADGGYRAGDGISISREDRISVKAGSGLAFDTNGTLKIHHEKEMILQEYGVCSDHLINIVANSGGYVGLSKNKSAIYYSSDLENWRVISAPFMDSIVYVTSLAGKFVAFKYVNVQGVGNRLYEYYSLNGVDWVDEDIYYTDTFAFNYLKTFDSDVSQFLYVLRKGKHSLHVASNGLGFVTLKSITDAILNDQQFIVDICFNGDAFIFLDSARSVAFLPRNVAATTKYNRITVDFLSSLNIDLLKYGSDVYCFASKSQENATSKVYFSNNLISGTDISSVDLGDVVVLDLMYSKYSDKFYVLVKKDTAFEVYAFNADDPHSYRSVLTVLNVSPNDTQSLFSGYDGRLGILYNFVSNGVDHAKAYLEKSVFL